MWHEVSYWDQFERVVNYQASFEAGIPQTRRASRKLSRCLVA